MAHNRHGRRRGCRNGRRGLVAQQDRTVVTVAAEGWFTAIPRCPVHGELHRRTETEPLGGGWTRIARSWWECPGWDGEGCEYQVADEDLDWKPLTSERTVISRDRHVDVTIPGRKAL